MPLRANAEFIIIIDEITAAKPVPPASSDISRKPVDAADVGKAKVAFRTMTESSMFDASA
jgi:hypothetical protein